ncbi:MAG: AAA domain-containing protein [Deltaproteobacteria bacterium]|nr:AAA domain-containing protein [Deltaproteobacteria bacterium]
MTGSNSKITYSEAGVNPKQLTIDEVQEILLKEQYVCDRSLATVVYLSLAMGKPLLLEGEAGVGKTEIAKVLAKVLNAKLIRLQCYEGLDANTALYEWNYPKQMLRIKLEEVQKGDKRVVETEIFNQDYLLKRPLLEAIISEDENPPVLLIDEIDRADVEFEAFLLEVLSDFQITIPEIGTIQAKHRPYVFLTSNRTREIHDALKRRCLYHWIEYPTFEKEYEIISTKFPEVAPNMAKQICAFMQRVREMNFYKRPGVAETLDWATALIALNRKGLDDNTVVETMGCVFKYREDLHHLREQIEGKQLNLDALLRSSPELRS